MASSRSSIINLIKEYIARLKENNISVEKVLLFGSNIKGTSREDSDIDIAVISSSFKCVFRRIRTLIPRIFGHPFQSISDTYSKAKRTPPDRSEATLENL